MMVVLHVSFRAIRGRNLVTISPLRGETDADGVKLRCKGDEKVISQKCRRCDLGETLFWFVHFLENGPVGLLIFWFEKLGKDETGPSS